MVSRTYAQAGVDQQAADDFVEWLERLTKGARWPGVVAGVGGFAGLYELPGTGGKILLAGCTDGVGTKLKLAFELGRHDTVGIDLVAMNVNDLVTTGARPLFFLDYLATAKLEPAVAKEILKGIIAGCKESSCALLGGETAQMAGFYAPGEYDLAGFAVGLVRRKDVIDGSRVRPGDVILGLASSGVHSNGYTLVRKILAETGRSLKERPAPLKSTLGEELLKPTRIYEKTLRPVLDSAAGRKAVKALAHITGSGIPGNLPRVLPEGCQARIDRRAWPRPPIFELLARWGNLGEDEMFDVFNMGIGMIVVADRRAESRLIRAFGTRLCYRIGEVAEGERKVFWIDRMEDR